MTTPSSKNITTSSSLPPIRYYRVSPCPARVRKRAHLSTQHQQHVGSRQQHARKQRQPKQQVEAHGRADHFCQVGRHDRQLAQQPQRIPQPATVCIAAVSRQVHA
jgi:hypothetical protein